MDLTSGITIRRGEPDEVIPLRHAILREGLPVETARFDGDDEPTTVHLVAERRGAIVGCVTIVRRPWHDGQAYQLRGMAVDPSAQRAGVGRRLLAEVEAFVRGEGFTSQLWCNARVPAVPFYEAMGCRREGDVFDIPTAGPHVRMHKRLRPERAAGGR
jgi:GNAT superfamily N-acetyltransferase